MQSFDELVPGFPFATLELTGPVPKWGSGGDNQGPVEELTPLPCVCVCVTSVSLRFWETYIV